MNNAEKNGYSSLPIIDCHLHMLRPEEMEIITRSVENAMDYFCFERVNLCAINQLMTRYDPFNNARCFYVKSRLNTPENPNRCYVFANLWHYYDERDTAEGYLQQVKDLMAMGADGIKLLDGKPEYRKKLARPLDDPIFDPMFAYLEENEIPVLYHVGDPGDKWDPEVGPRKYGDFLDDTHPTLPQLWDEAEGILKKFPKLHICWAHFLFLGFEPQKAKELMDRYENMVFDTTPGGEMFVGFTTYPEWRQIFIDYADRILYGSDTYNTWLDNNEDPESAQIGGLRINQCRRMLEWSEPFEDAFFGHLQPMHLPQETFEKIYYKNFLRFAGNPRPLNHEMIAKMARVIRAEVKEGTKDIYPEKDRSLYLANANQMIRYFET